MRYYSCLLSGFTVAKQNALFLLGQELYQLSKEKAEFSVVAGEEEESTAGSSGENEGNSRSSTPHKMTKTPPNKSPAKAKKPEGKAPHQGGEPHGVFSAFCTLLLQTSYG